MSSPINTLRRRVEGCAALLALIAPDWLDVRGADGSRRLDDPHDFVGVGHHFR